MSPSSITQINLLDVSFLPVYLYLSYLYLELLAQLTLIHTAFMDLILIKLSSSFDTSPLSLPIRSRAASSPSTTAISMEPNLSPINKLPTEIVIEILKPLDSKPYVSQRSLHRDPAKMINRRGYPIYGNPMSPNYTLDLKSAILVCRKWRDITAPWLFRHAFFNPYNEIPFPNMEDHFLMVDSFLIYARIMAEYGITPNKVESLTIVIPRIYDKVELRPDLNRWKCLFKIMDPSSVTVVGHPELLGKLFGVHVAPDRRNFTAPYNILQVSRKPENDMDTQQDDDFTPCRCGLLGIRNWTSLLLNEGSFLNLYERNEMYRNLCTPSLLHYLLTCPMPCPRKLRVNITHLSYIAISPLSSHTRRIVASWPRRVRSFYLQLKPQDNERKQFLHATASRKRSREERGFFQAFLTELFAEHTIMTSLVAFQTTALGRDYWWQGVFPFAQDPVRLTSWPWKIRLQAGVESVTRSIAGIAMLLHGPNIYTMPGWVLRYSATEQPSPRHQANDSDTWDYQNDWVQVRFLRPTTPRVWVMFSEPEYLQIREEYRRPSQLIVESSR